MKLFFNAKFYTMRNEGDFFAAALVNENGVIKQVFPQNPDFTNVEKIDLQGAYVYPGFIDTHTHSFEGGLYSLGVDLGQVKNLKDVFALISDSKPMSGKIFAYNFDERKIAERRFPTADELDRIHPDLPVILRRIDGHSCAVNSKAISLIDWPQKYKAEFMGLLRKEWNGYASNWFHRDLDDETIIHAYQKASKIAVAGGHTTVHTMIGDARHDPMHFELIQKNLSSFGVEFILYPQISDVKKALQLGSTRMGGCILADGSFGSHTAALKEPYSDDQHNFGILYRDNRHWKKLINEAHNYDLQVAVHCIGDAAIDQILSIYEEVQKKQPKDLRHEIIHCELTSDDMLDRIAACNASAVMQPMFDKLWAGDGGLYENRLGKERTARTNRLASVYDRGILLTGGSDWYITELNALAGIEAAINIHNENERLTPYQAIEIYTKNAAELSFDENRFGTLEKGKEANFVCLSQDIFVSGDVSQIQIKSVFRRGNIL
jgi:hypothetical protein